MVSTRLSFSTLVCLFPAWWQGHWKCIGEGVSCGHSAQGREILPELLQVEQLDGPRRGSHCLIGTLFIQRLTALGTAGLGRFCSNKKMSMLDVKLAFIYWIPSWVPFLFLSWEDSVGSSFDFLYSHISDTYISCLVGSVSFAKLILLSWH